MASEDAAAGGQENFENKLNAEQMEIDQNLSQVKHKILVLSGKGGVGKSTVAANLATSLSLDGKKVGLLDIDLHGPSIPGIFNLEGTDLQAEGQSLLPVDVSENLKIMSIGFMLANSDDAVIWRGPRKYHMIKQFLKDVKWGELDYLIIDSPPGTGDEPLAIVQLLGDADGAVIVTTPQQVALSDVRKGITFCRNLNLPVLGVLENMSGFVCPHCGQGTDIFKSGGGEQMATQMNVPFLGRIPIDPQIVHACDAGEPYIQHYSSSNAAKAFKDAMQNLLESEEEIKTESKGEKMRIAIPLAQGQLSLHFGHCDQFAIFEIDDNKTITSRQDETPPAHEPGVLPKWLGEIGVNIIIASGMGQRAQQLFTQNGIKVVVGASSGTGEEIIAAYLQGTLKTGDNICDH
jgi:Mrp family chromosome partitioning ATPase/predicted Fe-Mo cluster-binding NifX family protein